MQNNALEGLEQYQKSKKRNSGVSIEKRKEAREKRKEVSNYSITTNKEFIFLSTEQQELQLIMKIRAEKLKEELSETSMRKSALISEDVIKEKINGKYCL